MLACKVLCCSLQSVNLCTANMCCRKKTSESAVLCFYHVLCRHCSLLCVALQVHGGAGVCDDFPLASMWAGARTLRLADGPDDVHLASIAKFELAQMSKL